MADVKQKSMKFKPILWVTLSFVILFLSACTKDTNIGEDLVQLPGDQLNVLYVDTLSLQTYSELDDSIRSDETSLNMLGSMYDNVFGTTTAGFYTQLRLATNNLTFGTLPVCDSIVLALKYNTVYGDANFFHVVKVFELTESIYKDSTYYTNNPGKTVAATPLANIALKFNSIDSVNLNGQKTAPHLRIKLDPSFANKIMAKSGQTELSNNEEFLKFIKGLYVTAAKQTISGSIASFDLISSLSQLTIYYHNSTDTALKVNLLINENCERFTVFDHDYSNADPSFKSQVVNGNQSLGEQNLYIQTMAGVKTFIKIPHLTALNKNYKVAVQKAELIVNTQSNPNATLKPGVNLFVVALNSEGKNQFIDDYGYGSSGVVYDTVNTRYSFIITRHIQDLLNGNQTHYGLQLMTTGAVVKANGFAIPGPKAANRPLKLKLMYTLVK